MNRLTILRLVFWAAAAFSLFMAELPRPPEVPGAPSDKIQHIVAFATLAALASAAYPKTRLALIAIGLSAFGAAIELIQMIPAISRDSSFLDWLADTVAAVATLVIVQRLRARRTDEARQEG